MTVLRYPTFDNIAVAAPVRVPYQLQSDRSVHWWLGSVLAALVRNYNISKSDIDGMAVASYGLAPDNAASLTEYFDLPVRWLEQLPFGGASGAIALRHAARAVAGGDADLIVCLAADRMTSADFAGLIGNFTHFARDYVNPYGQTGPNGPFSLITDAFLRHHRLERGHLAQLVLAQRRNGAVNPEALQGKPLSEDAYMTARRIAGPVHLYDCVRPCCGGEGFIVTRLDLAEKLQLPHARVLCAMERHGYFRGDPVQGRIGWALDSEAMLAASGLTLADIDFVEAYDDYPVIVALQLLEWGFAKDQDLGEFLRSTDFTTEGAGLPVNTGGGQLALGQAGAAGGFLGVVEAVRQLIGQPSGAAVKQARTALVSGYGTVNFDRGLCCSGALLQAVGDWPVRG